MLLIIKVALLLLTVSAQWEEMDFEFADAPAYEDEVIRPGDSNYDSDLFADASPENQDVVTLVMADINECAMNIVYKYDLSDEIKAFFESTGTADFIEVMESGTTDEIRAYLAEMLEGLAIKIFGVGGEQVVALLSDDMIEWIKHTSILWLKNMGSSDLTYEINSYIDEDQDADINAAQYEEYALRIAELEQELADS